MSYASLIPPVIGGSSINSKPHPKDVRNERGELIGYGNCRFYSFFEKQSSESAIEKLANQHILSVNGINHNARNFIPQTVNAENNRDLVIQETFNQASSANLNAVEKVSCNSEPPLLLDSESAPVAVPNPSTVSFSDNSIQPLPNSDSHKSMELPLPRSLNYRFKGRLSAFTLLPQPRSAQVEVLQNPF